MNTVENIFDSRVVRGIIDRINKLSNDQTPLWGKMNVSQMLAHCNVTYTYVYSPENFKKPSFFMKLILKYMVKKYVISDKEYNKNGKTASEFIISDSRDFEKEKFQLIENILRTQQFGANYFHGKHNFSFGKMTASEWNTMFYKHLDHHLRQFGV